VYFLAFSAATSLLEVGEACNELSPAGAASTAQGSSLSAVAHRWLGRPLDKAEQVSDWSHRPLRQAQVSYAANDAHVLVRLFQRLRDRCAESGGEGDGKGDVISGRGVSGGDAWWRLRLRDSGHHFDGAHATATHAGNARAGSPHAGSVLSPGGSASTDAGVFVAGSGAWVGRRSVDHVLAVAAAAGACVETVREDALCGEDDSGGYDDGSGGGGGDDAGAGEDAGEDAQPLAKRGRKAARITAGLVRCTAISVGADGSVAVAVSIIGVRKFGARPSRLPPHVYWGAS